MWFLIRFLTPERPIYGFYASADSIREWIRLHRIYPKLPGASGCLVETYGHRVSVSEQNVRTPEWQTLYNGLLLRRVVPVSDYLFVRLELGRGLGTQLRLEIGTGVDFCVRDTSQRVRFTGFVLDSMLEGVEND